MECIKYENEKYIDLERFCIGLVVLEFICLGDSSQACWEKLDGTNGPCVDWGK